MVPVRLTSLKGVDLNVFRFDYDLTFALVLIDPRTEGTIARYGARDGASATDRLSVPGLTRSLRAAVAHMRGKTPAPAPRRPARTVADAFPVFAGTKRAGEACYHCHYAHDAALAQARADGTFAKAMLFRYPLPESVGITLDVDRGNVVRTVLPGSPAATADVRPGDMIRRAEDTAVFSSADLQWALDPIPDGGGTVRLSLERAGKPVAATLKTAPGWRRAGVDISWRPSQGSVPPILGLWEKPLTAEEKEGLGIAPDRLALKVNFLFPGEKWKAARGGLRMNDVIVAVGGQELPEMTPRQFHAWFRLNYDVGQTATFTVLRAGKRTDVAVPCVDVGLE